MVLLSLHLWVLCPTEPNVNEMRSHRHSALWWPVVGVCYWCCCYCENMATCLLPFWNVHSNLLWWAQIITPGLSKVNLDYWYLKTSRLPPAKCQSACAHRGWRVCSLLNSFHLAGNEMENSLPYWSAFPADTLHRRGGDRVSEGSLHTVLSLKQVQKGCTAKLPYWKAKVRTIILHKPIPCTRL